MSRSEHHYGWHSVLDLMEHEPEQVLKIFVQKDRRDDRLQRLTALAQTHGVSLQFAHKDTLEKLARHPHHQGVVASVRAEAVLGDTELLALLPTLKSPLLLILDQVTDPHNVGACIRTAVNMGVDALIVPKHHSSGLTPTVRKVAAGGANHLPFFQVNNLARTLDHLKEHNITIIGTALDDNAKPIYQHQLTEPLAIVMGAEDTGMRQLTTTLCDHIAFIPMYGPLQSLNVSVATGIVLYEVAKQRHA